MVVAALLLAVSAGCHTHAYLRDTTLQTTATLADLSFQQVLDNVARFHASPATLPSIAVVNQGTVTVADQKGYNGSVGYSPTLSYFQQAGSGFPILQLIFGPNASRNLTENWSLAPVTDMDKLRRVRAAFQLLVLDGAESDVYGRCRREVADYFFVDGEQMDDLIPKGWYCVGCRKQVPKNACYVGNYCDTYVWVMPEGIDDLSRFTMTVMELATHRPETVTRGVVKTYKSDGSLESTQVSTTESDREALERMKREKTRPAPTEEIPTPPVNPGLFFVPR